MKATIEDITYPNDGKILDYYKGLFDSAYIVLSPFIEPITIDIELFYPDTYPKDELILNNCKPKSWKDMCNIANIDNINLMDIGLRSRIGGLQKEFISDVLIHKIESLKNIVPPSEGLLSPFIEEAIFKELIHLGYNKIIVRSEHLDSIEIYEISKIIGKDKIAYAGSILTEDGKYYITTHWDSHYSIICANNKYLRELVGRTNLEGFYCNDKTEVYWSIRSPET